MSVMASRPPNMPAGAGSGPSKRPRLSLQIKASSQPNGGRSTASRPFSLNPSDPTAFNTLSNAYVTAVERSSTPVASPITAGEPLTAITTFQAISLYSPIRARPASAYPATPLSALPSTTLPAVTLPLPSAMSPTPPVSAGAVEGRVFSFSPQDAAIGRHSLEQALHAAAAAVTNTPISPMTTPPKQQQQRQPATRATFSASPPPYTHAKALRSILRNSPLPSRRTCSSPRRLTPPTVRIQPPVQRAAKRVCYHSPIEQEITTNLYTKSHIDLLVEEATSPCSPRHLPVDLSRVFSANEIRDGGQTPGGNGSSSGSEDETTMTVGVKRTARGEKKRRWVWTIGKEEEAEEDEEQLGGAVVAAARAAAAGEAAAPPLLSMPKPKVKLDTSAPDVEMS